MLNKKGKEVKEDFKDKIINSLSLLDSEIIKEKIQRQNKDYTNQFNDKYNDLKIKIQKAPDFLRTSLNRSLEDIRKKAESFGINLKK